MSFTKEVKREIIETCFDLTKSDEQKSSWLTFMKGYLDACRKSLTTIFNNDKLCQTFISKSIAKFFNLSPSEIDNTLKRRSYSLTYSDLTSVYDFFGRLDISNNHNYYLAGVFMACGSISSPLSAKYHLEMSFKDQKLAHFCIELIKEISIEPKLIFYRNRYLLYLKKAVDIADFLSLIRAEVKMMEFESTRIEKDFFASATRVNNCTIANQVRTNGASLKQIATINRIGIERLSGLKLLVAKARLENVEYSNAEIADYVYQKSGIKLSKSKVAYLFSQIEGIK